MKLSAFAGFLLAPVLACGQPPADMPLITNGAVTVTAADFEAFMLRVPEKHHTEVRASLERIGKAVEAIYSNRVLAEEARREGLDRDPRVRLRMKQIEESYLAQLWTERYQKSVPASDLSLRAEEIYRLEKERYAEPERFTGSYLIVSYRGRTREAAAAIATGLRKRALAGESFDDLARAHSDDLGYAKNQGRIEGAIAKELEKSVADAAFALKARGEITPPVMGKDGVLLVRMESKAPGLRRPFAEVREEILEKERERIVSVATEKRIGELKNTERTTVYGENVGKLRVDIPPSLIENAVDVGKGKAPR